VFEPKKSGKKYFLDKNRQKRVNMRKNRAIFLPFTPYGSKTEQKSIV
jgi:hypothetical protein